MCRRRSCGQVIADWTGIPVGSMVKDEAETASALEERLGQRVVGQEDAVQTLADAVRSAKTGMTQPGRAARRVSFHRALGRGKNRTRAALADELFGGEKFLTIINMSEYQEKHTVSQLKGSPPGYVGYGEGGCSPRRCGRSRTPWFCLTKWKRRTSKS